MYSRSIQKLIQQLKHLPSVGERTAERYVFHLLKSGKGEVNELRQALGELLQKTKSCEICWNFSDSSPCPICRDKNRNQDQICVVAAPQDVPNIEKTGVYQGLYHILRGTLDAGDPDSIKSLKIKELGARVKNMGRQKNEVILALNPDLPGETTSMYLTRLLTEINPKIKITRLARGLPMGSDIQYADDITLGNALKDRK